MGKIRWDIKSILYGYRKKKYAKRYGDPVNLSGKQHLHIYPTLACHLRCYFCQNRFYCEDGKYPKFKSSTPEEWASFLNRMYGFHHVDVNGGEGFNYHGMIELLNLLDHHNIVVFTNLPSHILPKLRNINSKKNNITLACSYHPLDEKRSVFQFAEDFKSIPKNLKPTLQIISVPEVSVKDFKSAFVRHGIYVFEADSHTPTEHNRMDKDNLKSCMCHSDMDCIAPDLTVYRCLGLMLWEIKDKINGKHISEYEFNNGWQRCDYYVGGNCGPCTLQADIKELEEK